MRDGVAEGFILLVKQSNGAETQTRPVFRVGDYKLTISTMFQLHIHNSFSILRAKISIALKALFLLIIRQILLNA